MAKIPVISAKTMIAFLKSLGFSEIRCKGSHRFYKHPDGRTATVPDHKGEDLGKGITHKILKDIEISEEEFKSWLQ